MISVTMLTAVSLSAELTAAFPRGDSPLLYRPIAVKVLLEKHFAWALSEKSHEAATGTHAKRRVPAQEIVNRIRNTVALG
jgi:hypothetical protein